MSEDRPAMSMCVNLTDYHKKTIKWQAERIKELERQWVSVKDRLPKDDEEVLVFPGVELQN